MNLILAFSLALLLTAALMPLCLRFAGRLGLIDVPEPARKVHAGLIPRSGGIAIVAGSLIAVWPWMPLDGAVPLFVAIAIVVLFGYLDDRYQLPAGWKLAGQLAAAMVFVVGCGGVVFLPFMGIDPAPAWLCLPLTVLFVTGLTNAVNLSDGMDGLAAGNSLLSLILLALLAAQAGETGYVLFSLALAGGLLGFLRFNTHPARIFMGDTGSQFLGFCAAAVTVLIMQNESLAISPALPLLIFGLPILDTAMVMTTRFLRGVPIFAADRRHLHHQLMDLGFLHFEVVIILYVLQAVAVVLAWVLRHEADVVVVGTYTAYCAAVLGALILLRGTPWRAHHLVDARAERRNLLLRRLDWLYRHAGEVIAAAVAGYFLACAVPVNVPSQESAISLLLAGLAMAALWVLTRNRSAMVTRVICCSATAVTAVAWLVGGGGVAAVGFAGDVYLALLALALLLGMRLTRRNQFRLDSQDYLVLLIVAVVPFVQLGGLDQAQLARFALRMAVVLYACEFVLARAGRGAGLLNAAGLTALVVIAT